MSFRVFVVCEDHTLDQYVVVPIVKAMLSHLGKPKALVKVVTNPRLTGISHVESQFVELAERYSAIGDVVIFAVDRDALDGVDGRGDRAQAFETRRANLDEAVRGKVEVILAVEETEVWALWGSRADLGAAWSTVRAERDSKELYFDPQVTPADLRQPGGGRGRLVSQSLSNGWGSLVSGCPELKALEDRLATHTRS